MLSERRHLEKARRLLLSEDAADLRYCALELRTSIELMCYDRLSMYIDEIPKEYLKKWRPQDVVNILLECDPDSDKDCAVSIAKESPSGAPGPGSLFGTSKGISKRFIQAHYHKLAQYLHAPTLADTKAGLVKPHVKIKEDLQETLTEIEHLAQGSVLSNFGTFIEFTCQFCKFPNKRNKAGLHEGKKVKCVNPHCPAEFTVNALEAAVAQITPVMAGWTCAKCQADQFVLPKQIVAGQRLICCKCEAAWEIGYTLKPLDGKATPGAK